MNSFQGAEIYFTEIPASEVVIDAVTGIQRYRGDTGGQTIWWQFRVIATNENPSIVVTNGANSAWHVVDVLTKIV